MALAVDALLFVAGLALLVAGAEGLVRGGASLAARLGISTSMVGATVVALGTSAPELMVGVAAARQGNADVVLGSVLGSDVLNILLVLGLTVLVAPITVKPRMIRMDIPILMGITIGLMLFALRGHLDRLVAALLLAGVAIYVLVMRHRAMTDAKQDNIPTLPTRIAVLFTVVGIAFLALGGHFVVEGGTGLAKAMGISDRIIALTLVALGTSSPELAASLAAARKGETGMAMGNISASNILNLVLVLGTALMIHPTEVSRTVLVLDMGGLLLSTTLLWVLLVMPQRRVLDRRLGLLLLAGYGAYLTVILINA